MEGGAGDSSNQLCARAHLLGVERGYLERDEKGGLGYSGKLVFIFPFFPDKGKHDANWSMIIP